MTPLSHITDLEEQVLHDSFLIKRILSLKVNETYLYRPFYNADLTIEVSNYGSQYLFNLTLYNTDMSSAYQFFITYDKLFQYKVEKILA